MWKQHYKAVDKNIWQGREDGLPKERMHQSIQCVDLTSQALPSGEATTIAFLGFCCDEGIKRNQGRLGAKQGPEAIRKALCNLSLYGISKFKYIDVGDISCDDEDLESAQQALGELVAQLRSSNIHPIVLGGGHEVAWGHYQGLEKSNISNNIGIINLDAHFDLRPLLDGNRGTSGTSFLQIANDRKEKNKRFNYLCLGIQDSANTESLFKTANKFNTEYIRSDAIYERRHDAVATVEIFLASHDAIYLSLCMDVFGAHVAPGVSSPQVMGILPHDVQRIIRRVVRSGKVRAFDIAELSPPHDDQGRTAKLAAQLICTYLNKLASI